MLKVKLKISGMGCAHCERAIEKALMELKGIKYVKADAKTGTAEIEAEVLDKPELERAVREAGYEVTSFSD